MKKIKGYPVPVIFLVALALFFSPSAGAEHFDVEGTDLGMGAGARYMGMGGSAVALADDVYAAYWNPANLVLLDENQFTVSGQLNSALNKGNFTAFAFGENDWSIGGLRIVPAVAYMKRLSFDISGVFGADDLETVFLEYVLPGIPEGFDGRVRSQTEDYRLVMGAAMEGSPWSAGVSIAQLHCDTGFCGVTSDDPGNPKNARIVGRDVTFNAGVLYRIDARSAVGATIRDINTRLKIDTYVNDANGISRSSFTKEFPTDFSVGWSSRRSGTVLLTADYQMLYGNYGTSEFDFKTLRVGYEKQNRRFTHRLGFIIPFTMEASITKSIKDDLPFSLFTITAGAGVVRGKTAYDLAFYAHPMMSYQRGSFYPGFDLSITRSF